MTRYNYKACINIKCESSKAFMVDRQYRKFVCPDCGKTWREK